MEFHSEVRWKRKKPKTHLTWKGKTVIIILLAAGLFSLLQDSSSQKPQEPNIAQREAFEEMPVVEEAPPVQAASMAPAPEAVEELTWHEGNFASRQPFGKRLQKLGLNGNQVHNLVQALTPVYDFRKAHPNHRWKMSLQGKSPRQFTLQVSPFEIYDVFNLNTTPELVRREIETTTDRVVVRGEIEDSLYRALSHVERGPALVAKLAGVFAWDIDFYQDPRRGDTFEMLIEKRYIVTEDGPQFVDYGDVMAARYIGARDTYEAFRFKPSKGKTAYFDARGKSLVRDVLRSPLKITRVTSSFKRRRFHPVLKRYKPHNGVDYGAPKGTPVMAVASGKVVRAGRWGGAGIAVVIKHNRGMETQYFHLSGIAKGVRRGVRVKQGRVIGYVGSTGLVTATHLHFGMKKNGKYVNPLSQKFEPGAPIPKVDREAFNAHKASFQAALAPVVERKTFTPVVRMQSPLETNWESYGPRVR
ncbi:MAG: M23 family metallopeptidase [Acidobacteriota bacterium]|nr:M23 family metallopeptidase [Acidobacteriota bacterium]